MNDPVHPPKRTIALTNAGLDSLYISDTGISSPAFLRSNPDI